MLKAQCGFYYDALISCVHILVHCVPTRRNCFNVYFIFFAGGIINKFVAVVLIIDVCA